MIQGENLAVLEALLPRFESSVRCCYIDPPYNNQERHYHYHDSRDHPTGLTKPRPGSNSSQKIIWDDGSLWISIDDRKGSLLESRLRRDYRPKELRYDNCLGAADDP